MVRGLKLKDCYFLRRVLCLYRYYSLIEVIFFSERAICVNWRSHYLMFNGGMKQFQGGTCRYVLSHTPWLAKSDQRWFSITSEMSGKNARIRIAGPWNILIDEERIVKVYIVFSIVLPNKHILF